MPPLKLGHLTADEHQHAAELLKVAQDNLSAVARLVDRAPYIDRYLDVAGAVQEVLVDPLRDAWDEANAYHLNPYPGVHYGGPRRVRRKLKRPDEAPCSWCGRVHDGACP